jgi:hypothetical protein
MYTYTIREKEESRPDPVIHTKVFTDIGEFLPCLIKSYTQYAETVKSYLPHVKNHELIDPLDSEDEDEVIYDKEALAMVSILNEEYEKLNPARLTREWLEGLPVGESIVHAADSRLFHRMFIDSRQMYFVVIVGYRGSDTVPKRGWIIRSGNTDDYKLRDRMGHGTITTNPYIMVKKVNAAISEGRVDAARYSLEYTFSFDEPFTLADLERITQPVYLYYSKNCHEGTWIEVYVVD